MSIPQSFIQELLSRVDVVDVVGRYVQLKKSGANFMGLCPFHGEKSPSFSVSPSKQFFHCFGCGKNGNAIGFLMDHAGLGFREAVQELAQQTGMQVPEDENVSPQQRERAAAQRKQQATLTEVLEKAGNAYRKHLAQSSRAIEYLKGRGVSGQIAKRYGLGYAPEGWRALASVFAEYDNSLLTESGLVIESQDGEGKRYDRFRDRVMFPIRNVKGECIGFGGRVLGDEKPKYLNSPETPVFHKGRELYGLFEARTTIRDMGYVLVTEGYMDVVALAQLGFPNAVATLGTACTSDHVHKLFRFTDTVVFSFDGDAAGRRAARKALEGSLPYASDTRSIKFLFLPAEHDPDSFIREHGADAFARHVSSATPLSRFLLEAAAEGCDLGQAEGRAHMSSNARPLWNLLPEGALKRQLLADFAQAAQLPSSELDTIWQQATQQESLRQPHAHGAAHNAAQGPDTTTAPADAPHWADGDDAPRWESASHGAGMLGYPGAYAARNQRPEWGARTHRSSANGGRPRWSPAPPAQPPMPSVAVSREDQAVRLLLSHMDFLENFSPEDMATLAHLEPPHGPVFGWIEQQFLTHGAQPWAVLRERLHNHANARFAMQLMDGHHAQAEGPLAEIRQELRDVLGRIVQAQLERENTVLALQAASDPRLFDTYRRNMERIRKLRAQLAS